MNEDTITELLGLFDGFEYYVSKSKAKNKEALAKMQLRKIRKRLNDMHYNREI